MYCYHRVDTSVGGLLVPESIIRPEVSVWALTLFIRYVLLNLQLLNNIIINKSQVLLPQALMTFINIGYPVYALLFYCSQNLKLFRFPIFRFLAYLIKVIPETCRVYSS